MIALESRAAVTERFARIISLAVHKKINLGVIDEVVSNSRFARDLDRGVTSGIEGTSAAELFEEMFPSIPGITGAPGIPSIPEITGTSNFADASTASAANAASAHNAPNAVRSPSAHAESALPTVYDDAYWCGWAYMQLFFEYRKPIAYLILTMPLSLMLRLYPVYHEMDVTQLFERYEQEAQASTIMSRLLKRSHMSSRTLSERSGVPADTINYYRKADENLYRAGFQQAYRLVIALGACPDVLLREVL